MSLTETTKTTPAQDEVIFFINKNYTGTAYLSKLGSRVDIWKNYLSLNDKFYSVKVGGACTLVLYQHGNFGGITETLMADKAEINMGGPGSGLSGFIVLNRQQKEHAILFTFKDNISGNRSMTLRSSSFPEGGENGVIQPNPTPEPGTDPNAPRVFAILKESNTETLPITVAIYVRKSDGSYEDIGATIYIYWENNKVNVKKFPDFNYGELNYTLEEETIHFTWG